MYAEARRQKIGTRVLIQVNTRTKSRTVLICGNRERPTEDRSYQDHTMYSLVATNVWLLYGEYIFYPQY